MSVPKGFRKNLRITTDKVGPERRQEILDGIDNQGTFLPRGVYYEDMDKTFLDFVEKDLEIVIDGEKVPVIFLTIQRWSEFSKTWQFSDKFKDIKLPFITVVRRPEIQPGTNQAGNWNIPERRVYTYLKVPTFEGGRKGVDVYKIPQPTSVDMTYEVRLFCNRMRDLNKIHKIVQLTFQSRQHYIYPNGHPMPVHLELVSDESPIDDFENRRFYVQTFEMKLLGYLLDEDEYEVIPTVSRILAMAELEPEGAKPSVKVKRDETTGNVNYTFIIKPGAEPNFEIKAQFDIKFDELLLIQNVNGIIIKVDNVVVNVPFVVERGQTIRFEVDKGVTKTAKFILKGKII